MGGSDWSGASGRGGMSYRAEARPGTRECCGRGFNGNDFAEVKAAPAPSPAPPPPPAGSAAAADRHSFQGELDLHPFRDDPDDE